MVETEFKRRNDCLISKRTFWFWMALYAAFFGTALTALGAVHPHSRKAFSGEVNSAGTLIFGAQGEVGQNAEPGFVHAFPGRGRKGALSLRPLSAFGPNSSSVPAISYRFLSLTQYDSGLLDRLSARADRPHLNETAFASASEGGISAMQIASMAQGGLPDQDITPVAEPATWCIAALAAVGIGWRHRRRLVRKSMPAKRGCVGAGCLAALLGAVFVLTMDNALAEPLRAPRETVRSSGSTATSLSLWPSPHFPGTVTPTAQEAEVFFAPMQGQDPANMSLRGNQSFTMSGAPGETVTLDLKNFSLTGAATFVLQGAAITDFIINVTKSFSLAQDARIVLSGGVLWSNVLFNVIGSHNTASLSGQAFFTGMLVANERTVRLTNHATIFGSLKARRIVILNSAQVITPPVISP